jgi:hypothetical protein
MDRISHLTRPKNRTVGGFPHNIVSTYGQSSRSHQPRRLPRLVACAAAILCPRRCRVERSAVGIDRPLHYGGARVRPQEVDQNIMRSPFTEPTPGLGLTPSRAGLVETSRRNRGTRGGFQKGTLPIVPGLWRPLTRLAVHLYPIRVGRLHGVTPYRPRAVRGHSRGLSSRSSRDGWSHTSSRSLIARARTRRRRQQASNLLIRTQRGRPRNHPPLEYGHLAPIGSNR